MSCRILILQGQSHSCGKKHLFAQDMQSQRLVKVAFKKICLDEVSTDELER